MSNLDDLQDYYVSLLVIQYKDKPKAIATIKALVELLMPININTGNLLINDIENAFDIDTAVGVQLDQIGQWVGIDRFYNGYNFSGNEFVFFNADLENSSDFLNRGYADTDNPSIIGGTFFDDNNALSITNSLNDNDFRLLIKLKILQNNSNHSWANLNDSLYKIFGNTIYIGTNGAMHMAYFVPDTLTPLIKAAASKGVLPRPLGVTISGLIPILPSGEYFSFMDAYVLMQGITIPFLGYSDTDVTSEYSLVSEVPMISHLLSIADLSYESGSSNGGHWLDCENIIAF